MSLKISSVSAALPAARRGLSAQLALDPGPLYKQTSPTVKLANGDDKYLEKMYGRSR